MKKIYRIVWGKYGKQKTLKIIYSQKKTLVRSIICSKCGNEDKKNI